jgi:hypothetical protein
VEFVRFGWGEIPQSSPPLLLNLVHEKTPTAPKKNVCEFFKTGVSVVQKKKKKPKRKGRNTKAGVAMPMA